MSGITVTKRTLIKGYEIVTDTTPQQWLDIPQRAREPVVGTRRAIRVELDNGAVILWPLPKGEPEPTDADLLAFAIKAGVSEQP